MRRSLENRLCDLEAPYKEMDDPYAVYAWILHEIDIPEAEKMIKKRYPQSEIIIPPPIGELTLEQLEIELKKVYPKHLSFADKSSYEQFMYALNKAVGSE